MKLAEYLAELDPKLAGSLERALDAVRSEFESRIADTVKQTVADAEAEADRVAAEQVAQAPEAAPLSALDVADELRLAALDIDRATTQSTILETLSRGILRFASRVAIFVNRGDELHGWSASGFGEADAKIRNVSLGGDEPFPPSARLGEGSVALASGDCAAVCNALGAELPSMGLVMPFVLADQVVGTVYCDRRGDEPFSVSALQLLTFLAGQTLETLPVRKREATATLALAEGIESMAPAPAAPLQPESPPVAVEDAGTSEPVAASEAVATVEAPAGAPDAESPDVGRPEAEAETPAHVEPSAPDAETPSYVEPTAPDGEPAVPGLVPETMSAPPLPEPEPVLDAPAEEESTRPGAYVPETPGIEAAASESAQPGSVDEPAAAPATPAEPQIALSSTQVAPPSDLEGPGWAFTSSDDESPGTSESEHEEAQRLARLLVTEIKLYNEEAVESGRQDANLYSRLQEDIDRSRQIFEDRIDPAVRDENDYFKQALVRILAGGDPALLGI